MFLALSLTTFRAVQARAIHIRYLSQRLSVTPQGWSRWLELRQHHSADDHHAVFALGADDAPFVLREKTPGVGRGGHRAPFVLHLSSKADTFGSSPLPHRDRVRRAPTLSEDMAPAGTDAGVSESVRKAKLRP